MTTVPAVPGSGRPTVRSLAIVVGAVLVLNAAPTSAVIIGSTAIGSADDGDSNYLNGSKVAVGASGAHVTSMSAYVGAVDAAPNNQYQAGIYTDNNGAPGTLVVASAAATLTPNAWNTVAITADLQSNTAYWLMYNTNGRTAAVNNMYYTAGSAGQGAYSRSSVAFGAWPASFGLTTLTTAVYALYATADSGAVTPAASPTPTAAGTDARSTVGEWSALMDWPLIAIHANLLKTGKVLVFDEEDTITHPMVWDPATLGFTSTPIVNRELWCSGHTQLADGQVLVAGGHAPHVGEVGINDTFLYVPDTNTWTTNADMFYDRWYPSLTRLGNGRVAILTGQITTGVFADVPEMYDPVSGTMSALTSIATSELAEEEYPADLLLPTGKVLCISPQHGPVQLFDAAAPSWTHVNNTPILFGSAVQYRPGRILMTGGGPAFLTPALTRAAVLDTNAPAPAWQSINSMSFGRYMHNLVMLPTGDVLAVGGSATVDQQAASGPLPVELWKPDTGTWTRLAALQVPRMYHSTALLLPDGRVLAAGGGHNSAAPNQFSAQIYSPPYLFKGARPAIGAAPDVVVYATPFTVGSTNAPNISSVSLIALGAVTHSNDMNQRYTELAFTSTATQLMVSPPADHDQVPPGYYMLFIVDSNRVPSIAKIVKVAEGTPPAATPTSTPPAPTPTRTSTRTAPPTSTTSASAPTPSATASATPTSPPHSATASATRTSPPPSATAPAPSPSLSPSPKTLGLTAIGSTLDSGDSNFLNGSRITTSSGGQIASMSVHVGAIDSNSNSRNYQMAIYTDNGGRPGTLIANTTTGTLVANAWNTLPITATLQPNTSYWLMYNTNGRTSTVNNMHYNDGSLGQGGYSAANVNFGTWPATFPTSTLTTAIYSLYATFAP